MTTLLNSLIAQAGPLGYLIKDQRKEPAKAFFTLKTRNKVQVEIKQTKFGLSYVTGFTGSKDKLACLREELESQGSVILHQTQNFLTIQASEDVLQGFWILVAMIEEIDELVKQAALRRSARFCESKFDYDSVYLYSAKLIRLMLDNGRARQLGRGNGLFDEIDSMITIGYSVAAREQAKLGKSTWREHIVPCDLIITRAVEMVKSGSTDEEIAGMIFANLFIVILSPEEAAHLDYTLGLKTTMPNNWKFGDDPLARLTAAAIPLEQLTLNTKSAIIKTE